MIGATQYKEGAKNHNLLFLPIRDKIKRIINDTNVFIVNINCGDQPNGLVNMLKKVE